MSYNEIAAAPSTSSPRPERHFALQAAPTGQNVAPPFCDSWPWGRTHTNPPSSQPTLLCKFCCGGDTISSWFYSAWYFSWVILIPNIEPQPPIDRKSHKKLELPPLFLLLPFNTRLDAQEYFLNTHRWVSVAVPLFNLSSTNLWWMTCKNFTGLFWMWR